MADDEDVLKKENENPKGETEVSEASLEEIAEQPAKREADIFSESSMEARDMPTPTLTSDSSSSIGDSPPFQEPLERSASEGISEAGTVSARAPEKPRLQEQEKYVNVYNMPDYTSREEVAAFKQMRERGMSAENLEELRHTKRTVLFETPSQLRETEKARQPNERDYAVMEVGKREEESRSPFERKRDYRPLKR